MAKRNNNGIGIRHLQTEVQSYHKENIDQRREIEILRNDRSMLLSALDDLTSDESYWSEDALKSGIVWRLKNVLTQIKNNG